MKKRILFVIPSLDLGGAEKSLISLLSLFDYEKYDVDLVMFSKKGVLLSELTNKVNLVPLSGDYLLFYQPFFKSLLSFLTRLNLKLVYYRILFFYYVRIIKNPFKLEQKLWKIIAKSISVSKVNYDVAIGYLEKSTHYFILDKIKANYKIGWIHSDLEQMDLDLNYEFKKLKNLDKIITVSDGLTMRLMKRFPSLSEKIYTVDNIVNKAVILKLSNETSDIIFDNSYFNIIFVGRLAKEKGLLNALKAIKLLLDRGYKVRWYLIGTGDQKDILIQEATLMNIRDDLFFLDFQRNPYKYITKADLFLLTSFYEGKSIALEEAKILNKLIVITDFSSAKNQIDDGVTGLIAKMNPEDIADKIALFIDNLSLRKKIKKNLINRKDTNDEIINKLYNIIDNE